MPSTWYKDLLHLLFFDFNVIGAIKLPLYWFALAAGSPQALPMDLIFDWTVLYFNLSIRLEEETAPCWKKVWLLGFTTIFIQFLEELQ